MQNRLEDIRKNANMSQIELAYKLKVSRQTIYSIEKGIYNPSVLLALKLAEIFNCKVEEIFYLEGNKDSE